MPRGCPGTGPRKRLARILPRTETPAPAASPLAPLRDPGFRIAWLAFLAAQVVIWAQTVGAVDVITERSDSEAVVSLLQTAISLPGVVLALFAGAVADVLHRGRLLVASALAMTVAMSALATLTALGAGSPAAVLAATAALGAALAMFLPAFSATVPDIVPREMLAPAVAITNVSVNLARAAGPAMAGVVIGVLGAEGLFWMLAVVLAGVVVALIVLGPRTSVPERPERIAAAVRSGARYARFSAPLRAVLARTALFILFGSALWALLPLVAVRRLGLEASDYGMLLACVGAGAVGGAVVLPRLQRYSGEALVAGGSVALAAVLAALAAVEDPVLAVPVLVAAGVLWIAVLTGLLTAAQMVAPAWVRGRALASWLLAYQVGFAAGGVLWGVVAETSVPWALIVPGIGLAATALAGRVLRMPEPDEAVLEPANQWADPVVVADVDEIDGPVLVTVEYDVADEEHDRFVAAMQELSAIRRRDGALTWELYEDVEAPGTFVETFTAATWGEHLRHHERGTQLDVPLEQQALSLARTYTVRHLVGARRRSR